MDPHNLGYQGLNFSRNEMYQENATNFTPRRMALNTNPTPSTSFSQMMFEPPYSTHHIVDNNRTPIAQRQQTSPFFSNPNWGNNFPKSSMFNANMFQNNNSSIYKPQPFVPSNNNPFGSTNAYRSYALNANGPVEPEIQVIDLEHQFGSTKMNEESTVSTNNVIVESTEKLQIENQNVGKTSLKRKQEFEDADGPNSKRPRMQTQRVLTGSIDRIIQWHKILPKHVFSLFETIGPCINIRNGFNQFEKRLLLRDERGPVLQVSYYETEVEMDKQIAIGMYARCIGRMVSGNRLVALKISFVPAEKVHGILSHLQRITFKLENTINRLNC